MEKKLDTALCTAALLAVFALFLWVNVPVVMRGLSSADDAFFSVMAKNIAMGKGYGWPRSSDDFRRVDPFVNSTGPALMLPMALLVRIFGLVDQLPGAATLVIFIAQLLGAAILLARRFGWTPTCGFLTTMLWLLMLASAHNWYFGSFFGETVAFGFVLIGTVLLAITRGDRGIAIAALCFSLSYLTKQISLFAVFGIVGAWLIVSFYEPRRRELILRRIAILILFGSILPLAFEVWKLVTLGLDGYKHLLSATWDVTAPQAIPTIDQSTRMTTFLNVLRGSYMSSAVFIGLALVSALLLLLSRRNRDQGQQSIGRFAAFAWSGAAVYLAYILLLSILWQRYFWIGIAVMLTAIAAPILALGSRLRMAAVIVLLVGTVGIGLHRPLYSLHQWVSMSAITLPPERAAVVRLLDDNPNLPYAAFWGSGIFDIVYLRHAEGTWLFEPYVTTLRPQSFIAVINHPFTDEKSRFFTSVVATCEPLTPNAQVIAAYRCGEPFWSTYPDSK